MLSSELGRDLVGGPAISIGRACFADTVLARKRETEAVCEPYGGMYGEKPNSGDGWEENAGLRHQASRWMPLSGGEVNKVAVGGSEMIKSGGTAEVGQGDSGTAEAFPSP